MSWLPEMIFWMWSAAMCLCSLRAAAIGAAAPFTTKKPPPFHVLPDKQYYHCFGCKKGGGVINFIMEIENLSYPDAVRFLAKRANIPVPEDRESDRADSAAQRLLELNRDAARYYYDTLQKPEGAAVQAYLDRRQIRRGSPCASAWGPPGTSGTRC